MKCDKKQYTHTPYGWAPIGLKDIIDSLCGKTMEIRTMGMHVIVD